MTAATIIVAVALAKILLAVLAARPGRALDSSLPSREDADNEEEFAHVLGGQQFDDSPTGNLPSEEYSSAAGSRQALGDFRDPDEYNKHQIEHSESDLFLHEDGPSP
jgi:hypothetical protein